MGSRGTRRQRAGAPARHRRADRGQSPASAAPVDRSTICSSPWDHADLVDSAPAHGATPVGRPWPEPCSRWGRRRPTGASDADAGPIHHLFTSMGSRETRRQRAGAPARHRRAGRGLSPASAWGVGDPPGRPTTRASGAAGRTDPPFVQVHGITPNDQRERGRRLPPPSPNPYSNLGFGAAPHARDSPQASSLVAGSGSSPRSERVSERGDRKIITVGASGEAAPTSARSGGSGPPRRCGATSRPAWAGLVWFNAKAAHRPLHQLRPLHCRRLGPVAPLRGRRRSSESRSSSPSARRRGRLSRTSSRGR